MSASRGVPRLAARVALAAVTMSGATASLVWALGAGHQARRLFGLGFTDGAREPGAALEIATTNLCLGGACLVAAWAVARRPQVRLALDAALGLLAAFNAAAFGVALGAYGLQLLQAIALHGVFELAAFALAGGAYLAARRGQLAVPQLARAAAGALSLLLTAALLETYVQPGGDR